MSASGAKSRRILLDFLREIRIEAGLRQVDLAKKLNVPQARISKYELGERRIDLLELRAICEALEFPFLEFVEELEKRIKEKGN